MTILSRITGGASRDWRQMRAPAPIERFSRARELSRELAGFERQAIDHFRREGRIGDEIMRELEREIDLREIRLGAIGDNPERL